MFTGNNNNAGGSQQQESGPSAGRLLTKTREKVTAEQKALARQLNKDVSLWRVLLHDDNIHTFEFVIDTIVKVVPMVRERERGDVVNPDKAF